MTFVKEWGNAPLPSEQVRALKKQLMAKGDLWLSKLTGTSRLAVLRAAHALDLNSRTRHTIQDWLASLNVEDDAA